MRNRTLTKVLDKIFWFIILLLPLITYIVDNFSIGMVRDHQFADQNFQSVISVFQNYFGYDETGLVADLCNWLGDNVSDYLGNIWLNSVLVAYATYMLQVEILHFMLDLILFIFKWARKLLDGVLV